MKVDRELDLLLDNGGPIIVWKEDAPGSLNRRLLITTRICDNPECKCRDVWLNGLLIDDQYTDLKYRGENLRYAFRAREGEPCEPAPLRSLAASLNVDSGKVRFNPDAPAELHDPELLAWLKEGMSGYHLNIFRKRWRHVKGIDQDQWRMKDWSWWQPGVMVSWMEVFPDDVNIMFPLGVESYWVNDMYCISPGCTCKEVGLAFFRITTGKMDALGAITVTLPSWRFSGLMGEGGNESMLRRLWEELRNEPGIGAFLKDRKKWIRTVGKEIAVLSSRGSAGTNRSGKQATGDPFPKVGRNDPCPCGSGKKYKKCCLGRVS